jgi:hypothetical protein
MEGTIKQAFDLVEMVMTRWPDTYITVDYADTPTGKCWVDFFYDKERENQWMAVVIKHDHGYGLYTTEAQEFGAAPDEVFEDSPALLARLGELL